MEETKRLTNSANCYVAYVDPSNNDSVGNIISHDRKLSNVYRSG